MAELTETLVAATEFAGGWKLVVVTATVGSSSDTIVLTEAQTGCRSIDGVVGAVITGGLDAAFTAIQVSVSALTITITSFEQDGTAATDFTGTTVSIAVLGNTTA